MRPSAAGSEAFVEVCGAGRFPREDVEDWTPAVATPEPSWMQSLNRRKDVALSRLAARLAAGSERDQVAGRLLMGDADGAALIAARTGDAAAYRLALSACKSHAAIQAAPSCRALTVEAWARLDPEDARPWMRIMTEAMAERDELAASEALDQVLRRSKRSPTGDFMAAVAAGQAAVDDPAGMGMAMIQVIGQEAALPIWDASGFGRFCSTDRVKEASRRDRCERIARWQFVHADSMLEAMQALNLADRVGLPADQRPYTKEALQLAMDQALAPEVTGLLGYDCASLRRMADWSLQRAQRGELAVVLDAVDQR